MTDRDMEYVVLRNRKPKKTRQYYYDDDDEDDDDDNSQIYTRAVRRKPRRDQRIKYVSSDEIDSDYRRQPSDPRVQVRKTTNGDRVILDEDDNIIKVIRNDRSPSPPPVNHRRLRHRPRESQTMFYERPDGHVVSRPSRKNILQTKKTQVVYADDEPIKIIKKVIIDPRTGDRDTIYEKDKPKKQQKYFLRQRPTEILSDSDDSDDRQQQTQYVRVIKHRTIPREILPRHEPSSKYIVIKNKADSEPVYALSTKMPAIKNNRRVVYEVPSKKPVTTYIYPTNGKYYK